MKMNVSNMKLNDKLIKLAGKTYNINTMNSDSIFCFKRIKQPACVYAWVDVRV